MEDKLGPLLDEMMTKADPNYKENPDIKWNFTKFLINRQGEVVARFEPTHNMEDVEKQCEALL
jgi:glutathione peroxidase